MIPKQQLAASILKNLEERGIISFGSGTTVDVIIAELGKIKNKFEDASFVSGSTSTSSALKKAGLTEILNPEAIEICIDGADQILDTYPFYILKGGGGALFREKILWKQAKRIIIAITKDKLVSQFSKALPIEVDPFAITYIQKSIIHLYPKSVITKRRDNEGKEMLTDNGNMILDCHGLIDETTKMEDILEISNWLKLLTGVIETGLFTNFDKKKIEVHIASEKKIELLNFEL